MDPSNNRRIFRKDLIDKIIPPIDTAVLEEIDFMDTHTETFTTEQTIKMKKLFFYLEKTLMVEMQHQTDAIFLSKYLQEDLVPRGLRVNLGQTFQEDTEFTANWKIILNKCSRGLINLLICKRNLLSDTATKDIETILDKLKAFSRHSDFSKINNKILTDIRTRELEFVNRKKNKLLRDRADKATGSYRTNNYKNKINKPTPANQDQSPQPYRKNCPQQRTNNYRTFTNQQQNFKPYTKKPTSQHASFTPNFTKIHNKQKYTQSAILTKNTPPQQPTATTPAEIDPNQSSQRSNVSPTGIAKIDGNRPSPRPNVSPISPEIPNSPNSLKSRLDEIRRKCSLLSTPISKFDPPTSPDTLRKRLALIRTELQNESYSKLPQIKLSPLLSKMSQDHINLTVHDDPTEIMQNTTIVENLLIDNTQAGLEATVPFLERALHPVKDPTFIQK